MSAALAERPVIVTATRIRSRSHIPKLIPQLFVIGEFSKGLIITRRLDQR